MKVFIIEINCSCHKCQLETICQPFGIVHTLSPAFIIKVSPVAKKRMPYNIEGLSASYMAHAHRGSSAHTEIGPDLSQTWTCPSSQDRMTHWLSPFHVMSYSPV